MANEQNLKPFKKGHDERRNTNGGGQSLSSIFDDILAGKISIEDAEGQFHKVTKKVAICLNIVKLALDADEDPNVVMKAATMVFDRTEGKPVTPFEHSGKDGKPIETKTWVVEIPNTDNDSTAKDNLPP
jgi:hypothetical protein